MHHPECKVKTFKEMYEEYDEEAPEYFVRHSPRSGIMMCHPDCPDLHKAKQRALQLAKERGWI